MASLRFVGDSRIMWSRSLALALIFLSSCAKNDPGGGPGDPNNGAPDSGVDPMMMNGGDAGTNTNPAFTRLYVLPADPTITVENGAGASLDFELWGTDQSGTDQKITGPVLWRVADDRLGTFADE